jgi:hypothetical protein
MAYYRAFVYAVLIAVLFAIAAVGCSIARTPDGSYYTLGQAEVEHCVENKTDEPPTKECRKLVTKGISGEFAGMLKALFGWFPGF